MRARRWKAARGLRWLIVLVAVVLVSEGARLVIGDIWTQTRGIGAGAIVLGIGLIWLAGT